LSGIKEIAIIRMEDGVSSSKTDAVAVEAEFNIFLNGQRFAVLNATPRNTDELVLGHLFSAGMIRAIADVKLMEWDAALQTVHLEALCDRAPLSPVPDGLRVTARHILSSMEQFLCKGELFKATGAAHSCALAIDGKIAYFLEDIGRRNAFDKTIGAALRERSPLESSIVMTSGRISGDIMEKIIRSRIQIAASRSAPTDAAVELARCNNVTLCGFARKETINIYTGIQRIIV